MIAQEIQSRNQQLKLHETHQFLFIKGNSHLSQESAQRMPAMHLIEED